MKNEKKTPDMTDRFTDAVLDELLNTSDSIVRLRDLQNSLRHTGWVNLGTMVQFRKLVTGMGFTVTKGPKNSFIVSL